MSVFASVRTNFAGRLALALLVAGRFSAGVFGVGAIIAAEPLLPPAAPSAPERLGSSGYAPPAAPYAGAVYAPPIAPPPLPVPQASRSQGTRATPTGWQPGLSSELSDDSPSYPAAGGIVRPQPNAPDDRLDAPDDYESVPAFAEGEPDDAFLYSDDSVGWWERIFNRPFFNGTPYNPTVGGRAARYAPDEPWIGQVLPDGLIYRSYLAGRHEPRLGFATLNQTNFGPVWEATLGGRVGIFRYGTTSAYRPEGWQIDVEGASFSRLDPVVGPQDLVANDYRFGLPVTYGRGAWEYKLAFWHLSSHIGDEYYVRNPDFQRINYVRNAFVLGAAWRPSLNLRAYGEVGWAFHTNGGAKPWELQFGVDYRPGYATGLRGAPFAAVNTHLLQDNNFSGHFVTQAGWSWRGGHGAHLFRLGFEYLNGQATQYNFQGQWEQQIGFGVWYDF